MSALYRVTPFRQIIRAYSALLTMSSAMSVLAEASPKNEQSLADIETAASTLTEVSLKNEQNLADIRSKLSIVFETSFRNEQHLAGIKEAISALELSGQNQPAQSRAGLAAKDLVCKWIDFPEQSGAHLVLPAESDDPVVAAYLEGQTMNAYMLDILSETTNEHDQVVDLGCHVGTFSVGASAMGRHVLSVDASQMHISLIERSKVINRFPHLVFCHAAVSQHRGTIGFIERGLFGSIDFSGDYASAVQTPTKGLDQIISESNIGPVRFLKMDIEGSEVDAILTGQQLLQRDQPIIWYESNGQMLALANQSVHELRTQLENLGYRTFRIEGERWIYAPPGQIQPEMWVDMIALNEKDQIKYAHRISEGWTTEEIVEKCQWWANYPHESPRRYLMEEIQAHQQDPQVNDQILQIGANLEAAFRDEAALSA